MPDKKLTDSEIVKALECCGLLHIEHKDSYCNECVFKNRTRCIAHLCNNVIGLINRLQAENQNLEVELQAMRGAGNSYKAENERLKGDSYVESETQKARPHFINAFEEALEKGNKPSGKVQFSKFQPLKANKIPLTEDLSEDGRGLSVEDLFKEISRLKAEKEDIKFLYENLKEEHLEIIKAIKHTKTEAYKEFADRLNKEFSGVGTCNYGYIRHKTRKVLKELVGE